MTQSTAMAYIPEKIRCNAVAPTTVNTEIVQKFLSNLPPMARNVKARLSFLPDREFFSRAVRKFKFRFARFFYNLPIIKPYSEFIKFALASLPMALPFAKAEMNKL